MSRLAQLNIAKRFDILNSVGVHLMKIIEKLYVANRDDWRMWLEKNLDTKKRVWLIFYKKHADRPSIPYDDAVEEALCF